VGWTGSLVNAKGVRRAVVWANGWPVHVNVYFARMLTMTFKGRLEL
jgi:hypothetical protein